MGKFYKILFYVFAGYALIFGISSLGILLTHKSTEGVVTKVDTYTMEKGTYDDRYDVTYSNVTYQYTVDGRTHVGTFKKKGTGYQKGDTITISYNSGNPSKSYSYSGNVIGAIGGFVVAIMLILFVRSHKDKKGDAVSPSSE